MFPPEGGGSNTRLARLYPPQDSFEGGGGECVLHLAPQKAFLHVVQYPVVWGQIQAIRLAPNSRVGGIATRHTRHATRKEK